MVRGFRFLRRKFWSCNRLSWRGHRRSMPSAPSMPSLWKRPVEKVVLNVANGLAKSRRSVVTVAGIDESKVEANRFVAAFCGTGTGHFTQTLAVIKILQKAGMTLASRFIFCCWLLPTPPTEFMCII